MDTHRTPTLRDEAGWPLPVQLGLLLPLLFAGAFYLWYPRDAWFLQDDFQLIMQYAHALQPGQILDFGSFGRFLSRNAYWHYGIQLFGLHAPLFYLLNLFLICATSLLAYRVVLRMHGRLAGVVAGLVYFCLPGTIEAYAWLSNSQHLMGHLFVMAFVYLFTVKGRVGDLERVPETGQEISQDGEDWRKRARTAAALLLVLALGLSSNAFAGMVLSLPWWMLLVDKSHRRDRWNWVVPVLGTALFLYFYARLADQQAGAYATSFSIGTFWKNAAFYFKGDVGASIWIAAVLGGAAYSWRQGRLLCAWLFIASMAFLLPFAFLEHQRYGSYSVLAHLFFVLGCLGLACDQVGARWPRLAQHAGAAMLVLVLIQSLLLPIRYYSENPSGKAVREQVEQLRYFDSHNPAMTSYCFRSEKQAPNTTGVQAWDIPAEWWQVGFGSAFSLFVNGQKTYGLVSAAARCDATFVFRGQRLERVSE